MYYIEKDNKILFIDEDKEKLANTILFTQPDLKPEDIKKTNKKLEICGETIEEVDSEKWVEYKTVQKRNERDSMLKSELDPIVSNSLRFNAMSKEEQQKYVDYRTYLLDFTKQDEWWKLKILTYDEWCAKK